MSEDASDDVDRARRRLLLAGGKYVVPAIVVSMTTGQAFAQVSCMPQGCSPIQCTPAGTCMPDSNCAPFNCAPGENPCGPASP